MSTDAVAQRTIQKRQTMITITSSSEQILKELREYQKAVFWLQKKYHGQKGYERMCYELMQKCIWTRQDQKSDYIEYLSPTGNRWIAFEYATYFPDGHTAESVTMTLCYRQTSASIEVFIPVFTPGGEKLMEAIVYTPHFFLRYNQRKGTNISLDFIINDFAPSLTVQKLFPDKPDEKGNVRFDVRLKGGIGRGWTRRDSVQKIYEVRSYLPDSDLTKKQLRETERTRKFGDMFISSKSYASALRQVKRLKPIHNMDEIINMQKVAGMDTKDMELARNFTALLIIGYTFLGYACCEDLAFWERHWQHNKDVTLHFAEMMRKDIGQRRVDSEIQLTGFAAVCAKRDGIDTFSPKLFAAFAVSVLLQIDRDAAMKAMTGMPETLQGFLDTYSSYLFVQA